MSGDDKDEQKYGHPSIKAELVDRMYQEKGRSGTYTEVVENWAKKADLYDELWVKHDKLTSEKIAQGNKLRGKIKRLENLIKKTGDEELIRQLVELLAETDPEVMGEVLQEMQGDGRDISVEVSGAASKDEEEEE